MSSLKLSLLSLFWLLLPLCFYFSIIDSFPQLLHLSEGVFRNIQKRFVRDWDASKRVVQSFGIIDPKRAKIKLFLIFLECSWKRQWIGLTHLKITIKFSVGPSCLIRVVQLQTSWRLLCLSLQTWLLNKRLDCTDGSLCFWSYAYLVASLRNYHLILHSTFCKV